MAPMLSSHAQLGSGNHKVPAAVLQIALPFRGHLTPLRATQEKKRTGSAPLRATLLFPLGTLLSPDPGHTPSTPTPTPGHTPCTLSRPPPLGTLLPLPPRHPACVAARMLGGNSLKSRWSAYTLSRRLLFRQNVSTFGDSTPKRQKIPPGLWLKV